MSLDSFLASNLDPNYWLGIGIVSSIICFVSLFEWYREDNQVWRKIPFTVFATPLSCSSVDASLQLYVPTELVVVMHRGVAFVCGVMAVAQFLVYYQSASDPELMNGTLQIATIIAQLILLLLCAFFCTSLEAFKTHRLTSCLHFSLFQSFSFVRPCLLIIRHCSHLQARPRARNALGCRTCQTKSRLASTSHCILSHHWRGRHVGCLCGNGDQ